MNDETAARLAELLEAKPDKSERCEHGIRWPHPCDDCNEESLKQHNLVNDCLAYADKIAELKLHTIPLLSERAAMKARIAELEFAANNTVESPDTACVRYLNELRNGFGNSVAILCDDEEALTKDRAMAIDCNGNYIPN
jgi:hypothetical protein